MPRTIPAPRAALPPETLSAIVERVRSERSVTMASLKLGKLAQSAEQQLAEALTRAGLEQTGKAIRTPLRDQLLGALERAGEAGIAASAVPRVARGARNAAEMSSVIRALIEEDRAALVAHGKTLKLTLRTERMLSSRELDAVAAQAKRLGELVKVTKARKGKPRPTLLRSVVTEVLGGVSSTDAAPGAARLAVRAALATAPATGGLVRVPDVVQTLEAFLPRAEILRVLIELAREGALELRPEAGLNRLSSEEQARCVRGLDGTPLSYIRRVAPAQEVLA